MAFAKQPPVVPTKLAAKQGVAHSCPSRKPSSLCRRTSPTQKTPKFGDLGDVDRSNLRLPKVQIFNVPWKPGPQLPVVPTKLTAILTLGRDSSGLQKRQSLTRSSSCWIMPNPNMCENRCRILPSFRKPYNFKHTSSSYHLYVAHFHNSLPWCLYNLRQRLQMLRAIQRNHMFPALGPKWRPLIPTTR